MKILGLLALAMILTVCGPWGRTPGFRLFGEVVRQPVTDWSFTDAQSTIAVQTRTRYGIPHSVTTVCVRHRGALYVPARNARSRQVHRGRRATS